MFSFAGETIENAFLVVINYQTYPRPMTSGTISIYGGNKIKFDEQETERLQFEYEGVCYEGGVETQEMIEWGIEPYNRNGVNYIPSAYYQCNFVNFSGGRFISRKKEWIAVPLGGSSSVDERCGTFAVLVSNNKQELTEALIRVLPLIGTPYMSEFAIANEIIDQVL